MSGQVTIGTLNIKNMLVGTHAPRKISDDVRLNEIFGEYVGVEIPLIAGERNVRGEMMRVRKFTQDGADLFTEIHEVADANGVELSIHFPKPQENERADWNRLNLYAEHNEAGNLVLQDKYTYG